MTKRQCHKEIRRLNCLVASLQEEHNLIRQAALKQKEQSEKQLAKSYDKRTVADVVSRLIDAQAHLVQNLAKILEPGTW